MNSFSSQKDSVLDAIGESAGARLSTAYAQYGIDKGLAESIASLSTGFHGLLGSARTQHDLAKQATASKDAGRDALLEVLAQASAILYAPQSTVTDAQLAAIGFAPRRSGAVQPKAAKRVTELVAVPNGLGEVTLSFSRAGNPKSAIFEVFQSADSEATWTMVASSSRTKVTVPLAPGTPMAYRIVAKTSRTVGPPSQAVTVYGAPPAEKAVTLELKKGGKAA